MDAIALRLEAMPPDIGCPLPQFAMPALAGSPPPVHPGAAPDPLDHSRSKRAYADAADVLFLAASLATPNCSSPRTPRTGIAIPTEHRFAPCAAIGEQAGPRPHALRVQMRCSTKTKRCLFGAPQRSQLEAFLQVQVRDEARCTRPCVPPAMR
jgi:hypothetical protein